MRRYTEYNDNELMRVIQTNPEQKAVHLQSFIIDILREFISIAGKF